MPDIIHLKANADLESRYKALLKKEWGPSLFSDALQLLDDQLRLSGVQFPAPREATVDAGSKSRMLPYSGELISDLSALLQRLRSGNLPPVPKLALERRTGKHQALAADALRTAVYLMVQAQWELQGEAGFFRDIQGLLLFGTVDTLLPELKSAGLRSLHDLLVNVWAYQSTVVWRDDPAHQQYLFGVLAGYLKDEELEGRSLLASFHLTDPREHDYVTKAQACVFYFLSQRRYDTAKSFLLSVLRQASNESLEELQEVLNDVYAEEVSEERRARRKRSDSPARASAAHRRTPAKP